MQSDVGDGLTTATLKSDVLNHAQTRLDNAIQKIRPFLREASVRLHDGSSQRHPVRYFFREAVPCDETRSVSGEGPQIWKPLIVFFHGLGCSKYDFVGAIDRLNKAHVLALDWPCTGVLDASHFQQDELFLDRLTRKGEKFSLDVMADFAHMALGQIFTDLGREKGDKFVLVGHSMGAKVATLYASKFSADISALVNIEGHLHPSDPRMARKLVRELDAEICAQSQLHADGQVHSEAGTLAKRPRLDTGSEAEIMFRAFQRIQDNFLESAPDSDAIAKWMQVMKRMTSAKGFFAQARAIASEGDNMPDRLWKLFVTLALRAQDPTEASGMQKTSLKPSGMKILHIYGQRNKDLLSTSVGIYRCECGANCSIKEISGSGHFPFFDSPDEFWKELESWLAENDLFS